MGAGAAALVHFGTLTGRVAVVSTFENRSFALADQAITIAPQSDLAILNYIARYIIETGRVDRDFAGQAATVLPGRSAILRRGDEAEHDSAARVERGFHGL